MLKRIILFALVVTTVPALIMSFPVLATDEELLIKLTGNGVSATTNFKIWEGSTPTNYQSPFKDNMIYHDRNEDVVFVATYQGDKNCEVRGRSDGVIPLEQEGKVIDEVSVSLTLDDGAFSCVVTLPTPSDSKLEMVVEVDDSVVLPTPLTVTDYNASGSELGYPVEHPAHTANIVLWHDIYSKADHSKIMNEGYACKFEDGTQIVKHTAGSNSKIYVNVLASSCMLSLAPDEPAPPLPTINIATCNELRAITDLTANYALTYDLECGDATFYPLGHFTGTFTSAGCDISNTASCGGKRIIHDLNIVAHAGSTEPVGLFTSIGDATIAHIGFENAKVTTGNSIDRGLIAGHATHSELIDITTPVRLTISGSGTQTNGASGGVIGVATDTTLTNVRLHTDIYPEGGGVYILKNQYAGGLIGVAKGTTRIFGSRVFPLIGTGSECAHGSNCGYGGLIGYAVDAPRTQGAITIDQSWSYGQIDTKYNSGGLVGLVATNAAVDIKDSSSSTILACDSNCSYAGGMVGRALPGSGSVPAEDIMLGSTLSLAWIALSNDDGGKAVVGAEGSNTESRIKLMSPKQSFFDRGATGKDIAGDTVSIGKTVDEARNSAHYDSSWDRSIWNVDTKPDNEYPELINNRFPL